MHAPPPTITSRANARVKLLRAAFAGRASRPGEAVGVEGLTLIEEARRSGMRFGTVFAAAGAEGLLPREILPGLEVQEVLVLSRDVFVSVVDTSTPHPVAATVFIPEPGTQSGSLRGVHLVLEDVQDPGNVGTLIRSAEAFGVEAITLTPGCANPWSPKVIRSSAGSVFRWPVRRVGIMETLTELRAQGVRVAGAVVESDGAEPVTRADLSGPVAILIGNEGKGLSAEALELLDLRVHIPCRIESLNAAIAGSILLYEAQRQAQTRRR